MKNNFKLICVFFAVGFFILGCSTKTVKWTGETGYFKDCEKIAVLEVIIGPPSLPLFPLIDAGLYNSSFEDIIPDVIEEHQIYVNKIDKFLGRSLQVVSKCDVIYGKELFDSKEYNTLKNAVETFDLAFDDDDFPEINIPDGASNFFDFYDTEDPIDYFDDDEILGIIKPRLATIAKNLGVSGLVIAVSSVKIVGVGMFGVSGRRLLDTRIYYFNSNGDLMAYGTATSESTSARGSNINDYVFNLEKYKENIYEIIRKIDINYTDKELETKIKTEKEISDQPYKRTKGRIKK